MIFIYNKVRKINAFLFFKVKVRFKVSQVYFMEYYMMGLLQNAQNHELERSRPVVYVEAKYFCHIKYDGDQFRYIAQREIQL